MCLGLNYAFKALALSGKRVDKIASLRALSHAQPEKMQLLAAWWETKRQADDLFERTVYVLAQHLLSLADGRAIALL